MVWGVVYRKTYDGVLFNDYDEDYKDHVLNSYYFLIHKNLILVKEILKTHDSLIIIDYLIVIVINKPIPFVMEITVIFALLIFEDYMD